MVKSVHGSLEAKLASIQDVASESEDETHKGNGKNEMISEKRTVKGASRKGRKKAAERPTNGDVSDQPSSAIYLGHLPIGFEEREITTFLNQFGNVKRCRVSRSNKTGRPRGYAFVEFADEEVAKIVAETMSGYFLLERRLVCHVLPNDKVHKFMFAKPARVPTKVGKQKRARGEVNRRRSPDVLKGITAKLMKREEMKRKNLAAMGIDYEFPGYVASNSSQPMDGPDTPLGKKHNSDTPLGKKHKICGRDEGDGDVNNADVEKTAHARKKRAKKARKKTKKNQS